MSYLPRSVLMALPTAILAKLDVNITLVLGPTTPPPGRWNCRITIMRQHIDVPNYSTEATADTIEEAANAAFEQFRKDMNL